MSRESESKKGFVIGLITGTVIGSVVALLFAPKSGKELRQDIKNKSNEILEDTTEYLNNTKERVVSAYNEAKRKVGDYLEDSELTYEKGKNYVEQEGTRIKTAVKAGIDNYKENKV